MRRRILIGALTALGLFLLFIVFTVIYIRSGRLDSFLQGEIIKSLGEAGIRAEMGRTHLQLRPYRVTIENLNLYSANSPKPLASVDRLEAEFSVLSYLSQRIKITEIDVVHPRVWIEIDEKGKSNIDSLHSPPDSNEKGGGDVSMSTAVFKLVDAELNFADHEHNLSARMPGVSVTLVPREPDPSARASATPGSGQLNHNLALILRDGSATYGARQVGNIAAGLKAVVTDTGVEISDLTVSSDLGQTVAAGHITSFKPFKYDLKLRSEVALDQAVHLLKPDLRISGSTVIESQIDGVDGDYNLTGGITSGAVAAEGFRVQAFRLGAELSGHGDTYKGTAELRSSGASGPDLDVGRTDLTGTVRGTGLDFNVGGPLGLASISGRGVSAESITGHISATPAGISISQMSARVFGGTVTGSASFVYSGNRSALDVSFDSIDLNQAAQMALPEEVKIQGTAKGSAKLAFSGLNYKSATGEVTLAFDASVSRPKLGDGAAAATGQIDLAATGHGFEIQKAAVHSASSDATATGNIGWDGVASLILNFDSQEMGEVERALDALSLIPDEINNDYELKLAGPGKFDGKLEGDLTDPTLSGHVRLASIKAHDEDVGTLEGDVTLSRELIGVTNGSLVQGADSRAAFELNIPMREDNEVSAKGDLKNFDMATLAKLAVPYLADFVGQGKITGSLDLTGLPGPRTIHGTGDISLSGAEFNIPPGPDNPEPKKLSVPELNGKVSFDNSLLSVRDLRLKVNDGDFNGTLTYNFDTYAYSLDAAGKDLDLSQVGQAISDSAGLSGHADLTVKGQGFWDDWSTLNLDAKIQGHGVEYAGRQFGDANLTAYTDHGVLQVDAKGTLLNQPREIEATVHLKEKDYPVSASLEFSNADIGEYLGLISPQLANLSGRATGTIKLNGPMQSPDQIQAVARITRLDIGGTLAEGRDYTVTNRGDIVVTAKLNEITLDRVTFTGEGTSVTVGGTIAREAGGNSNIEVDGELNLRLISSFTDVIYTTGVANVKASIVGSLSSPRLLGSATLKDAGIQVLNFPIAMDHGNGQIRFTEGQAAIQSFTAKAPGGGTLSISGGAALVNLLPDRWRIEMTANQVEADYPRATQTVFDGTMVLQGNRQFQVLSGDLRVRRASYTKEISLADLLATGGPFGPDFVVAGPGGRGGEGGAKINIDMQIDADETLVVRNNLANAVGSAHIALRGPIEQPLASGRVLLSRGTLQFRNDRYEIIRSLITFPPARGAEPIIDLQADADISGYRVTVGFSGPLSKLHTTLRSDPELSDNELMALVLTGQPVTDTQTTAATTQTGLGLATTLLSATLNEQLQKQTRRIFGLSRFSIDPLIVGRGADPTARVTLGQTITRDLTVTYSQNVTSSQSGLDRIV
ncbi:MAG TPA: translocation/assembly module TamB domain-containing protein, partial [Blastocatellia bacterium]|nr:translocation/assembly module TamB domain-containing protein [Blastocatellia bacterium]